MQFEQVSLSFLFGTIKFQGFGLRTSICDLHWHRSYVDRTVNVLDCLSCYKSVTFAEPQRIPASGTSLFDASSWWTVIGRESETRSVERLCMKMFLL